MTFTDDQQATATVTAVPLSIQVGKLRPNNPVDTLPVVALTPYPSNCDSLELQASVQGASTSLPRHWAPHAAIALEPGSIKTTAITQAKQGNGGNPQVDPGLANAFCQILQIAAGSSLSGRLAHIGCRSP